MRYGVTHRQLRVAVHEHGGVVRRCSAGFGSTRLYRYYCQGTIESSSVVAHNVQSGLTPTISGMSCTPFACNQNASTAAAAGWAPTDGISGVSLSINAAEVTSGGTATYSYALTGVPRASNGTSRGGSTGGHAPLLMLGSGTPDVTCTGHDTLDVTGTAAVDSTGTPALQTNGTASISASSIYTATPSAGWCFLRQQHHSVDTDAAGVVSADPYVGLSPPITEPVPNRCWQLVRRFLGFQQQQRR